MTESMMGSILYESDRESTVVDLPIYLPGGVTYNAQYQSFVFGGNHYRFQLQGGGTTIFLQNARNLAYYSLLLNQPVTSFKIKLKSVKTIALGDSHEELKLNLSYNGRITPNKFTFNMITSKNDTIELSKDQDISGGLTLRSYGAIARIIVDPGKVSASTIPNDKILEIYAPNLVGSKFTILDNKLKNAKPAFKTIVEGFEKIFNENTDLASKKNLFTALDNANKAFQEFTHNVTSDSLANAINTAEKTVNTEIAKIYAALVTFNNLFFGLNLIQSNNQVATNIPLTAYFNGEMISFANSPAINYIGNDDVDNTEIGRDVLRVVNNNRYNNLGFRDAAQELDKDVRNLIREVSARTTDESILAQAIKVTGHNDNGTSKGISQETSNTIKKAYSTFLNGNVINDCKIINMLNGVCTKQLSNVSETLSTLWKTFNDVITKPETVTCNYTTTCTVKDLKCDGTLSDVKNDQAFPKDNKDGFIGIIVGECKGNGVTESPEFINIRAVNNIMYKGFEKVIESNKLLNDVVKNGANTIFESVASGALKTAWNKLKAAFNGSATSNNLALTGNNKPADVNTYKTEADKLWAAFNCAFFGSNKKYNTDGTLDSVSALIPIGSNGVNCNNVTGNNLSTAVGVGLLDNATSNVLGITENTTDNASALTAFDAKDGLDKSILAVSAFKNAWQGNYGTLKCTPNANNNSGACDLGISIATSNAIKDAYAAFLAANSDALAGTYKDTNAATQAQNKWDEANGFNQIVTRPESFKAKNNDSCQKLKFTAGSAGSSWTPGKWENDGAIATCSAGTTNDQYSNDQAFPADGTKTNCTACTTAAP